MQKNLIILLLSYLTLSCASPEYQRSYGSFVIVGTNSIVAKVLPALRLIDKDRSYDDKVFIQLGGRSCNDIQGVCVFSNEKSKIYLSDRFFMLKEVEQAGLLVHKFIHLDDDTKHSDCDSVEIEKVRCDADEVRAIKRELEFYELLEDQDEELDMKKIIKQTKSKIQGLKVTY